MSDFDLLVVGDIDFIVAILNGIAGITNDEENTLVNSASWARDSVL